MGALSRSGRRATARRSGGARYARRALTKKAPTGKIAVARYALPNPNPASNKWTIEPHKDTLIQRGMVEPANDQPGGGVEVIFTVGTQPGTVTGPEKIPAE